ncbi:uncharacterized protein BDZ99DRAFT_474913 [Mytilinidion resinicola]|uniref:F-box domain-containing protein n=1 Tax=Mytilinidion resinicola TaxID=574789 RepID=A0A6A6YRC2_9PEZI|nr:uncharacterized protein BDZ99DRAFT_474913 [Mytilinidion resinicola]KAF2811340.1 hypothetical protein BDZ99DRAFT_474913 [Mytilinidion resinicola]
MLLCLLSNLEDLCVSLFDHSEFSATLFCLPSQRVASLANVRKIRWESRSDDFQDVPTATLFQWLCLPSLDSYSALGVDFIGGHFPWDQTFTLTSLELIGARIVDIYFEYFDAVLERCTMLKAFAFVAGPRLQYHGFVSPGNIIKLLSTLVSGTLERLRLEFGMASEYYAYTDLINSSADNLTRLEHLKVLSIDVQPVLGSDAHGASVDIEKVFPRNISDLSLYLCGLSTQQEIDDLTYSGIRQICPDLKVLRIDMVKILLHPCVLRVSGGDFRSIGLDFQYDLTERYRGEGDDEGHVLYQKLDS